MILIIIKVIGASLRAASRCPVRQRKRAVYAVTDRECNTAAYLATKSTFPAFLRLTVRLTMGLPATRKIHRIGCRRLNPH